MRARNLAGANPKTSAGSALDLNKLCSTLADRPADGWAPANDGTSLTATPEERFNSASLREEGAAAPPQRFAPATHQERIAPNAAAGRRVERGTKPLVIDHDRAQRRGRKAAG
jgi:hypothetical protein